MRVLVVEDEALIARRIERLTRELLGAKLRRIDCVPDMPAAAAHLEAGDVSLLLLDLNLSGQDGFEILRRALVEPFQTIVISANSDRAIEAFELGVVDFVPKPFTHERLAKAFARIDSRDERERTRFLAVALAGKIELVALDSVIAVHGDDDYSSIETLDGRRHLHKKTLSALERLLPSNFQRVHRSHIVNIRHAVRIVAQEGSGRAILLANDTRVPIGRSYADTVKERLIQ